MVERMSILSLDFNFCEHCVYVKKNWVSFPFGAKTAKGILEIVQSDVFRPMLAPSLCKFMYYLSFIDDFSRNTWIYFLKKKSKFFTGLKNLRLWWKTIQRRR